MPITLNSLIIEPLSQHKKIFTNYYWRFLQIFGKQGISLIIFFLIAKNLSGEEFGLYNYFLNLLFFLIIFSDFGISLAISKFVSQFRFQNREKIKLIFFNGFLIIMGMGTLVSGAFFVFFHNFLINHALEIWFLWPLIFLIPLTSLYDGIFRGLEKFKELALISLNCGIFTLILSFFLILNFQFRGAIFTQLLFYLILFFQLHSGYSQTWIFKIDQKIIKQICYYAILIGLASLGYYLYSRFDILILGHFGYFNQLNYFQIIHKVTLLLATFFAIFGQVIAPIITNLTTKHKYEEILFLFNKLIKISLLISCFISFILYFFLPLIIKLFLPHLYSEQFLLIFKILILIIPLNLIAELISQGFIIASHNAYLGLLTLPFGLLNIILSFIFIQKFGFLGIAYSNVIVSLFSKTLTWSLLIRKFKKLS